MSNLYQSAMEFLVNHTVHLEVIHEEERGTPPHIQNTIDREASRTNDRGLLRGTSFREPRTSRAVNLVVIVFL